MDYYAINRISNSFLGRVKAEMHGLEYSTADAQTLEFGKAFHASVLEPYRFPHEFSLSKKEIYNIECMKESALKNPILSMLLTHPKTEIEKDLFFNEPMYGLPCKAKLDIDNSTYRVIADLKTTDATSASDFNARIKLYGYDRQAAWYLDGSGFAGEERVKFILIAVSKTKPYTCLTFPFYSVEPFIKEAREEYEGLINYLVANRNKYKTFL